MHNAENKTGADSLERLASLEDLLDKKCKIYSRLLTDAGIAKEMETLALRHAERKRQLDVLLNGKKGGEER